MSKLKSAIYGHAVGDAIGVPFEFKKRGSFECIDMIGFGTHNQPIGTWSDDTSMILATCHSIKENKKIDIADIRLKFEYWLYNAEYTATGVTFDCGITTSQAIRNKSGEEGINSNGNGSLMRILPLAFLDLDYDIVDEVSSITHAHNISKEACRIFVYITKKLLNNENLKNILLNLNVSDKFWRLNILDNLSEEEIKSTGYVIDTLEASLWCLLKTTNYRDAVIKAVNLGEDTDTVGAITGGLAGLIYGLEDIPQEWIHNLKNKELIDDCLF